MLRIRLSRTGRKNYPSYRIVIAEHSAPIKGKFVEIVGHFIPSRDPKVLEYDADKINEWIKKGAKPTDTVASLLKRDGMSGMDPYIDQRNKQRKKKKEEEPEAPAAAPAAEGGDEKPAKDAADTPAPEADNKPDDDKAEAADDTSAPEADDKSAAKESKEEPPAENPPAEEASAEEEPAEEEKKEQAEAPAKEKADA